MCLWPPQAHDFPCFGQFQGTPESVYAESKLPHPIKMCGSHGSSVQCLSHAAIFLLYINIWLGQSQLDFPTVGTAALPLAFRRTSLLLTLAVGVLWPGLARSQSARQSARQSVRQSARQSALAVHPAWLRLARALPCC